MKASDLAAPKSPWLGWIKTNKTGLQSTSEQPMPRQPKVMQAALCNEGAAAPRFVQAKSLPWVGRISSTEFSGLFRPPACGSIGQRSFFYPLGIVSRGCDRGILVWLVCRKHTVIGQLNLLYGVLPAGVIELLKQQILLVVEKGNDKLGVAFLISLAIALWSANSGVSALFDALNSFMARRKSGACFAFTRQHSP